MRGARLALARLGLGAKLIHRHPPVERRRGEPRRREGLVRRRGRREGEAGDGCRVAEEARGAAVAPDGRGRARGAHVPHDGAPPARAGAQPAGGVPRDGDDFLLEGAAAEEERRAAALCGGRLVERRGGLQRREALPSEQSELFPVALAPQQTRQRLLLLLPFAAALLAARRLLPSQRPHHQRAVLRPRGDVPLVGRDGERVERTLERQPREGRAPPALGPHADAAVPTRVQPAEGGRVLERTHARRRGERAAHLARPPRVEEEDGRARRRTQPHAAAFGFAAAALARQRLHDRGAARAAVRAVGRLALHSPRRRLARPLDVPQLARAVLAARGEPAGGPLPREAHCRHAAGVGAVFPPERRGVAVAEEEESALAVRRREEGAVGRDGEGGQGRGEGRGEETCGEKGAR
mmetsp:Transcript_35311/g.87873  ORF Transcript_35311/g.87873 Transcript_35311/m.87873 type:complete len:409 (+) Transcript_35311:510-1736(+)